MWNPNYKLPSTKLRRISKAQELWSFSLLKEMLSQCCQFSASVVKGTRLFGRRLENFSWVFTILPFFDKISKYIRGRPKTTLTRFWPFLTTYLPLVDIFEGILSILYSKIYILLIFPLPPTYTSSCQHSFWMTPYVDSSHIFSGPIMLDSTKVSIWLKQWILHLLTG